MLKSLLSPVHRLIWQGDDRRAHMLLRFAEVEADGGRDLVRAAESTPDPLLRRLFLRHAADEARHAVLFRTRGLEILRGLDGARSMGAPDWLTPGERGLDDLRVEDERDDALLAFLHLSEAAAARDFTSYIKFLDADIPTREVFQRIVRDESFHMSYTREQLVRLAPRRHGWLLWRARATRLWKLYLRFAGALAGVMGAVVLTAQYFVLLPAFALLARRAARREPAGWTPVAAHRSGLLNRQY
jgi:rubrerythrin